MILLLIAAILCWLVAGIPGFVTIGIGRVDWGWLGMFLFGLWVLLGGGFLQAVVARVHRPPPQ